MSEHKSGAVSRAYHEAVIEKKDKLISTLQAQRDELLEAAKALLCEWGSVCDVNGWGKYHLIGAKMTRAAIANAEEGATE